MEDTNEEIKLSLISVLLVTGTSSLLFTGFMKFLDGVILQVFLRIGIICLGTGLLFAAIRILIQSAYTGKKPDRSHQ